MRGADGTIWDSDSPLAEERTVIEDYRLLQYDLLFGKQYSLRDKTEKSPSTEEHQRR